MRSLLLLLLVSATAQAFNFAPWEHKTTTTSNAQDESSKEANEEAAASHSNPSYTTPWRVGTMSFREKRDLEAVCRQEFPYAGAGRAMERRQVATTTTTGTQSPTSTGSGSSVGASVGPVSVDLPAVGLTLGNITTKIGNINLTVENVLITAGDINIENVQIGNITVIVSVPLPGQAAATPFSAFQGSTTVTGSTSIAPSSSVVTAITVSKPATTLARRQVTDSSSSPTDSAIITTTDTSTPTITSSPSPTDTGSGSVSVSAGGATVSSNPINIGAGSIDTEIGNVTIAVQNVNVTIGSITLKNITIGNIFVLVQIGQPDLTGLENSVNNAVDTIGNATSAISGSG